MIRQHFRTNIKNHMIIYCNKPTDLSDIKIDLEAHLYLNKDCKESNSNSLFMSIITVIFSIIGSGLLANDRIETSQRIIGTLLMVALIIFLGALINQLTNWLGSYLTNSSLCYKQILDILTEVEREKLQ